MIVGGTNTARQRRIFFIPFLLDFEAVGQKVEIGEREGDVGGGHCKEGECFADAENKGASDEFFEGGDGVESFARGFDQAMGSLSRDNPQDQEFPNKVDRERNCSSEDNGKAYFFDIAVHVGHQGGNDDLEGEGCEEDGEGKPGFWPVGAGEQLGVDVGQGDANEPEIGDGDAEHEQDIHPVYPFRAEIDDRRKDDNVEDGCSPSREAPAGHFVKDGPAAEDVGNHDREKEEEIDDPAEVFSETAEQPLRHGDQVGIFGHPGADFQKEKSRAEHEKPAEDVNERSGNEAAVACGHGEGKHADADHGPCNQKRSAENVSQ